MPKDPLRDAVNGTVTFSFISIEDWEGHSLLTAITLDSSHFFYLSRLKAEVGGNNAPVSYDVG